jgi:hypothetical protein
MAGHTHLAAVPSQVEPARVRLPNKRNFPTAAPTLEFLLARDRVIDVAKMLKPHHPVQMIPFCKYIYFPGLMLVQTALNVVCDPDVQCVAMFVGQNVHPVVVVAYASQKKLEMFCFAQHDRIARLSHSSFITCVFADSICASTPSLRRSPP